MEDFEDGERDIFATPPRRTPVTPPLPASPGTPPLPVFPNIDTDSTSPVTLPLPASPGTPLLPALPNIDTDNDTWDLMGGGLPNPIVTHDINIHHQVRDSSLLSDETVDVESSDTASEGDDVMVVETDMEEFEPVEIVDVVTSASTRTVIDVDNESEYLSVGNSTPSLPSGRTTPALSSGRSTPDPFVGPPSPSISEEAVSSDLDIPADGGTSEEGTSRRTLGETSRPATPYPGMPGSSSLPEDMPGQSSSESRDSSRSGSPDLRVSDMASEQIAQEVTVSSVPIATTSQSGISLAVAQAFTRVRDSQSDFRSPKRRRIMSPLKQKEVPTVSGDKVDGDEDEDEGCSICFEMWTSSGSHRLVSLKCGHLFGHSCIDKWLRGQGGKCPQCNAKAHRKDIRFLYAKTIKAVDTTDKDRALKELEREKEAKRRTELEAAQSRLNHQLLVEENSRLKKDLEKLRSEVQILRSSSSGPPLSKASGGTREMLGVASLSGLFVKDRIIKIWEGGNCRVMAYSAALATLVVSQPSTSTLFPGFGVKKLSTLDFKTSQYLTIHSKAIRDLHFHPLVDDGMLVSCGLDKRVTMTSVVSNTVIHRFEAPYPVWSCMWNTDDCHYFYTGLQNGTVLVYDVRDTTAHVQEMNKEGSKSPVVALEYVPQNYQANFRASGLLVGQLDRISFYEKRPDGQQRLHLLPLEGSLTSLHFEPRTRHLLASFRPTAKHGTIRHQLCELTCTNISSNSSVINNVCSCNIIHTFHGGRTQTVLSKSMLIPHPADNNRLLVCAGDEASSVIQIWDAGTGKLMQRLPTAGAVVDLCAITTSGGLYLAALTDKHLNLLKWT
ncbi:hypothetical protein ScPMuIL_016062 [Solemya velum]